MLVKADWEDNSDWFYAADQNAVAAAVNSLSSTVINVKDYGAVGNGSADDTTAIGSAITAAGNPATVPVYFPAGTYKVTAALNWKIPGLRVSGAGKNATTIRQHTANTAILQVAGGQQDIGHLTLSYNAQATSGNTASNAIEFGDDTVGSTFDSTFHDLVIYRANTGLAINPAITVKAGLFSTTLTNIRILDYSYSAIRLVGSNGNGANCTGCVFTNVYTHRNADTDEAAYYPIFIEYWDEITFNQLNIEHVTVPTYDVMAVIYVGNAIFNALHIEEVHLSANNKALIYTHDAKLELNGVTARFNSLTGSTSNAAIRMYGTPTNCHVVVNGWNASSNTTTTAAWRFVDWGSGTTEGRVTGTAIDLGEFDAIEANGDATCVAALFPNLVRVAGAVSDGSFPLAPPNGTMGLDTTNHRLYVRDGGSWRYAALT